MKLGGQMDYHGSRTYAKDLPSAAGSWVGRQASRLAAWTKQKLEFLLRSGAEQASETWLVRGDDRHFSLLGAEYDRKPRRGAAPCPFPEGEARTRRPVRHRPDGE